MADRFQRHIQEDLLGGDHGNIGLMADFPETLFRLVPDAYRYDAETMTMIVYEVEDSHPINQMKLEKYLAIWREFDGVWGPDYIRLFVSNRWGVVHEVNLVDYYYLQLMHKELRRSASSGVTAGTNRGEVRAEGPSETASAERPRRGADSEGEPNE